MKKILFVVLSIICFAQVSFATKCYWTAVSPGQWDTASNWEGSDIPDATTDTAFFKSAKSNQNCTLRVAKTVGAVVCSSYTGQFVPTVLLTISNSKNQKQFDMGSASFNIVGPAATFLRLQNISTSGVQCTVGNINVTGVNNSSISIRSTTGGTSSKFILNRIISAGEIVPQSAVAGYVAHKFVGDTVRLFQLEVNAATAGMTDSLQCGSTVFDLGSVNYAAITNGAGVVDYGSSKWFVSGNWDGDANITAIPGTSQVIIDSTSTITSVNAPFYHFKIAAPSSRTVTLADSLTLLGDFVDTLGKFKTAGFNVNLSGDFYRYSADSALWSTSTITLNKSNALWYRRTAGLGAPIGGMAQATMRAINGARFDVDTNMTVYRLVSAAGKKLQFTAGRIFKDSTYTSGDLNNDTLQSLTGGSKAYLNLPANTPLTDSWIKDIYAINTIYDTASTGLNGGNDSNVVFKYASAVYARSPTTVTVTSASPASVPVAGGTLDTITGTGFYPPCSVLIAGGSYIGATFIDTTKISFTTPASTAGLKLVTIKNGDFKTGAGSVLTYVSGGVTQFTLTMSAGAGGSVAPPSWLVDSAASTAISATANNHYVFNNWTRSSADATIADSTDATTTVAISANATVTGNFTCTAPTLTYTQNPACTVGIAFSQSILAATEFDSIVNISALPNGLTINKTNGTISGTPTVASSKTGYLIRAYGCSNTDFYDSITVIGTPTPVIDSIRPTGGIFGTQVTVRGHVFGSAPSGYLNGALVPYISRSDTTYVFNLTDIPERGNVPVEIVNNTYNTRDTIQFWIFYNPQLASITPNHGKTNQGDTVEIRGDTLGAVDTVWFQNDFVIPFSITDSLVKCEAPAHAPTTVNVSVHDTNGYVDTLYNAYEYNNLYGWTVTHPSSLNTAGGDTIKFHSEYGQLPATFLFDGAPALLTTNTDTLSTFVTPAHAPGVVPWVFDATGTVKTGSVRYRGGGRSAVKLYYKIY